jgi:hypothetical protein
MLEVLILIGLTMFCVAASALEKRLCEIRDAIQNRKC